MSTEKRTWKVGDLAKATGVTVRALHHYEEIGLLRPSARDPGSRHRVYSESDLARLQQILSLRQLGFPLEDIGRCLREQKLSSLEVIRLHKARALEERDRWRRLYERLSDLEAGLAANGAASVPELLQTIEVIQMYDKYFTQEQLNEIRKRKEILGEDKMQEYQEAWPRLIENVRAAMANGADPASAEVQKLAAEWTALVQAFSGGNRGIEVQLGSMYRNEPVVRERAGMDPELSEYVAKMMAHSHKSQGAG